MPVVACEFLHVVKEVQETFCIWLMVCFWIMSCCQTPLIFQDVWSAALVLMKLMQSSIWCAAGPHHSHFCFLAKCLLYRIAWKVRTKDIALNRKVSRKSIETKSILAGINLKITLMIWIEELTIGVLWILNWQFSGSRFAFLLHICCEVYSSYKTTLSIRGQNLQEYDYILAFLSGFQASAFTEMKGSSHTDNTHVYC